MGEMLLVCFRLCQQHDCLPVMATWPLHREHPLWENKLHPTDPIILMLAPLPAAIAASQLHSCQLQ